MLDPGPVTALVGEAGSGKSNRLVAIWKLLVLNTPSLMPDEVARGSCIGFVILEYAALHRRREATAAEGKAAAVQSGKPAIA